MSLSVRSQFGSRSQSWHLDLWLPPNPLGWGTVVWSLAGGVLGYIATCSNLWHFIPDLPISNLRLVDTARGRLTWSLTPGAANLYSLSTVSSLLQFFGEQSKCRREIIMARKRWGMGCQRSWKRVLVGIPWVVFIATLASSRSMVRVLHSVW